MILQGQACPSLPGKPAQAGPRAASTFTLISFRNAQDFLYPGGDRGRSRGKAPLRSLEQALPPPLSLHTSVSRGGRQRTLRARRAWAAPPAYLRSRASSPRALGAGFPPARFRAGRSRLRPFPGPAPPAACAAAPGPPLALGTSVCLAPLPVRPASRGNPHSASFWVRETLWQRGPVLDAIPGQSLVLLEGNCCPTPHPLLDAGPKASFPGKLAGPPQTAVSAQTIFLWASLPCSASLNHPVT